MEFKEYMIKKRRTPAEYAIVFFGYVLATIINFFIYVFGMTSYLSGIVLLLIVGVYYFTYILTSRLKKEYEYIFTKDNIDIDVIMNKSKRKRIISFSLGQTEIIASTRDENHNGILKGSFGKKIDVTSGNKDADTYFAVVEKNGRTLVVFEPPYAALEILSKAAKSKVHIYE